MSFRTRYADACRAEADRLASTPHAVARRQAEQKALAAAAAEMRFVYPVINGENFAAANHYRETLFRDAMAAWEAH